MRLCLNPKNPHKNAGILTSVATTANDSGSSSVAGESQAASARVAQEEHPVTCQFCKYLLEGAILGDCRVTQWIGSGAFGDVYEAEQLPPLNRRVAVKVMAVEHVADARAAELFAHEVSTIAALDHPHILPVLRVGRIAEGRPYLIMKFAAHGSLQKYCQPLLTPFSVLPTMSQAATFPPQALAGKSPDDAVPTAIAAGERVESAEGTENKQDGQDAEVLQVFADASAAGETLEQDRPVAIQESEDQGEKRNAEEQPPAELSLSGQETLLTLETVEKADDRGVERMQAGGKKPLETGQAGESLPRLLTPQQLLPYLEQAASALQYAHDSGILHLDVKPANLLLDAEDRLLLADFGVSALLEGYTHASLQGYVGTPLYTAPEQWMEQPRAASDQYALGVTCYQLLTGRAPFSGNLYAIMHGHIQAPLPPMRQFQPLIPLEVEDVIARSLAKEPTERYRDMRSFAQAYREAVKSAASSETDITGESYIAAVRRQESERQRERELQPLEVIAPAAFAGDTGNREETTTLPTRARQQLAMLPGAQSSSQLLERESPGEKIRPRTQKSWRRTGLILLMLLLVLGSTLGIVRAISPCSLGLCPALSLSVTNITLLNDDQQRVAIHNTGSADLHWSLALASSAPWLTLAPTSGILPPGQKTYFSLKSSVANAQGSSHEAVVQVLGQGLPSRYITVILSLKTGLSAIDVQASGTNLALTLGNAQLPTQHITMTNRSGQTLTWLVSSSENTWLVVTPGEGVLLDGKSVALTVSVNPQNLTPNTYLANVSLIGSLGKQSIPALIHSFAIQLTVSQGQPTVTPQVTPSPKPSPTPAFRFPTFSAQAVTGTGAPATLRSGHSMVWDDYDNLLLVFGGIDDKGNLLNDLWSFNPATTAWNQLSVQQHSAPHGNVCGIAPAPRMNAAMVWDTLDQQLLLYGGVDANNHYLGDLWSFSPATKVWGLIKCAGNGPGARSASAVWDGHEMLVLGGSNRYGLLSDFWQYTPAPGTAGKWQRLPDTPMTPRVYQTLVWDMTDSRLYVFGGLDASGVQQSDFWSYSATGGWAQIAPKSLSNPLGRQQAMGAWDSRDNLLFLMGGWEDGQGVPFWGFWVFDPKQNAWGLVTPLDGNGAHIIPGRTAAQMAWDATNQRAFIYAGAGNGKSGSSLNDLWSLM